MAGAAFFQATSRITGRLRVGMARQFPQVLPLVVRSAPAWGDALSVLVLRLPNDVELLVVDARHPPPTWQAKDQVLVSTVQKKPEPALALAGSSAEPGGPAEGTATVDAPDSEYAGV